MPLKNSETSERTANALNFVFVETLVDAYALQVGDAHLKLVLPLISKRSFNRKATVDGNHTEVQVTIESIGSNGVKYLTDAILRAAKADNTDEKILTLHTKVFASRRDTIPRHRTSRPSCWTGLSELLN